MPQHAMKPRACAVSVVGSRVHDVGFMCVSECLCVCEPILSGHRQSRPDSKGREPGLSVVSFPVCFLLKLSDTKKELHFIPRFLWQSSRGPGLTVVWDSPQVLTGP